jgi:hypothetical protein
MQMGLGVEEPREGRDGLETLAEGAKPTAGEADDGEIEASVADALETIELPLELGQLRAHIAACEPLGVEFAAFAL